MQISGFPSIRENLENFFQSEKSGKNWDFQLKSGEKIQIRGNFQQWLDRSKVVEMHMAFDVVMLGGFTFGKCICNKFVFLQTLPQ